MPSFLCTNILERVIKMDKRKIVSTMLGLVILSSMTVNANPNYTSDNITGKNRYETSGLIADRQKEYSSVILVNSDSSLSDGLSASSLAGALNAPILLVSKDNVSSETIQRIVGIDKIYIVGGNEVISSKVENQLKEINKELRVERIAGKDRFDTSYKIAKRVNEIQKRVDKVFFVNGYKGEADAMSVAPISARDKAPIILTDGKDVDFTTDGMKSFVIGSKDVMSDSIVNTTRATRIGGEGRFETNKLVIRMFYDKPKEFYLSKGYNLVDALTVSPLAKNKPVVLVEHKSDKSVLKNANKFTVVGGINERVIRECIYQIETHKPTERKFEYMKDLSNETLHLINEYRQAHGIKKVENSEKEVVRAKSKAEFNARNDIWGNDYNQLAIVTPNASKASEFIDIWTKDKDYRMKLLDKNNLQGGVAVYRDNFDKYFVVASFSNGFYYE